MSRRDGQVLLGVALAIALAMGTSIHNGFVYDDVPIVVNNPRVTEPAHWREIPNTTYWLGTLWRPLTVGGYALQWWLGNGQAWLFHAVSLLLYLVVALLAFKLMQELGARFWMTAVATIAFVVHPVHVEVIANVVGQAELWTAGSLVVATWLYLRARRLGTTIPRLLALLSAIAIAVMAKENGFVAPLLLIGAEWLVVPERNERWRTRIRLLIPATAFSALMLVVRSTVTGTLAGEIPSVALAHLGFRDRLVTFLATVPEYARLLVWPQHLQAEYAPPHLLIAGPITGRHVVGIVLIILVVTLFLRYRRQAPLVAFGLWWAAVAIGPVSSVVTAAGIIMAERVFFLSSLGFALALAGALTLLEDSRWRRLQVTVQLLLGMWIIGATVRSAMRVPVWHDQDRFFTAMPKDGPQDYRASLVAGKHWIATNRTKPAEHNLREAMRLWPHDASTNEFLGQLLRVSGRCGEAAPIFAVGLSVEPDRTSLRAKLFECLIVLGDRSGASAVAEAGIALGDSSFVQTRRRLLASPEHQ